MGLQERGWRFTTPLTLVVSQGLRFPDHGAQLIDARRWVLSALEYHQGAVGVRVAMPDARYADGSQAVRRLDQHIGPIPLKTTEHSAKLCDGSG